MSTTPITIAEFEASKPIDPTLGDRLVGPFVWDQYPSEAVQEKPDSTEQCEQYECHPEPGRADVEPLAESCSHARKCSILERTPELSALLPGLLG